MNGLLRYQDRATDRDWADILTTFPLFTAVSKRQLRKLVHNASFAELAPGERLAPTGASTGFFYVILGGEAEMLRPAPLLLRTGDYFSELGIHDGKPRSLHVVATRELHLMKLPWQSVLELVRRHPAVTTTLLKGLSVRLRSATAS